VRKQSLKSVLMKDGSARRIPGDVAEQLIASGQAKHYISNTVFRALKLGVKVTDPKTRDEKGILRDKIRGIRERQQKKNKKESEAERRKEEKEADKELYESSHDEH